MGGGGRPANALCLYPPAISTKVAYLPAFVLQNTTSNQLPLMPEHVSTKASMCNHICVVIIL